jgi:Putative DNA-binding domain
MSLNDAAQRERLRQQLLLRTLLRHSPRDALQGWMREPAPRARRALDAYSANAGASAQRALSASFPVVKALLGDESFAQMARAYWYTFPPARGDLAWLGESLPAFIESAEQLAAEPYLADCARLEWILARAEVASDAPADTQSLTLLAQLDPDAIGIELAPACALFESKHPIVTIWQAHRDHDAGAAEDRFAAVRAAFAAGHGESAWVWRDGWRARASLVDAAGLRFMQSLHHGGSLGKALLAGGEGFEFEAWLVLALERGSLRRAHALPAS